jgi:hypothetical protein
MGLDTSSAAVQSRIDDAIVAAQAAIDSDTGRTFEPVTATKVFGGEGYHLRIPDLISITTLKFDDDDDGTFELTIDAAAYELDVHRDGFPFDTVRMINRCFPTGIRRRNVEIVGSWGWPSVPAPINQACSLMAAQLAQRTVAALFGVQSMGEMGGTRIRSIRPDDALVGPYRRPAVA